jgi:hypothetical protein
VVLLRNGKPGVSKGLPWVSARLLRKTVFVTSLAFTAVNTLVRVIQRMWYPKALFLERSLMMYGPLCLSASSITVPMMMAASTCRVI